MPGLALPRHRRRARDDGFTLVEVVVSLGVFAVIAAAGAAVMVDALRTAGDNRERVRAASLADQEIEKTRAAFRVAPATLADGNATADIEGNLYTVERDVTWLSAAGSTVCGVTPCTAVTGDSLLVEVRVSWPGLGERSPVINTTVLS